MDSNKRVAVNTVVQYCRTAVNTCMSLYIVRVVLQVLGQEDYGIYSLVGGVVAMMGFVTNAMIVTTQRHLSYSYGKAGKDDVRILFSNSILLHLAIAAALVLLLLLLRNPIFSHYLVIAPERLDVARMVYVLSVAMLFMSFMTAPFKALFIARENIVYMSLVDVFDCFLKLLFALLLSRLEADKLLAYACMMLTVYMIQWLAFSLYAIVRFDECAPRMFFADRDWGCIRRLMNFAGWTTYGTTAIVLRNQGFAVILNHFLCSTVVNAAYGIAQQVHSNVSVLAGAIFNAMNPQVMKAEGAGDRHRMLAMARKESKMVLCVLSVFLVPLIVEMPSVLHVWLGDKAVSEYTPLLCQCMLLALMIDQCTYGLHTAVQAIGRIRSYTLLAYTPKLLLLCIMWGMFQTGFGITGALVAYLAMEALVAMFRIPYVYYVAKLNVMEYLCDSLFRVVPLIVVQAVMATGMQYACHSQWRFLFSLPLCFLVGLVVTWVLVMNKAERKQVGAMFKKDSL